MAAKRFSENASVGAFRRIYNKFQKSAHSRGIEWDLDYDVFCSLFTGRCSLTDWPISTDYRDCTASLDRIDNSRGYLPNNVRWVHSMVNMCKNKYDENKFIEMCIAIAKKQIVKNGDRLFFVALYPVFQLSDVLAQLCSLLKVPNIFCFKVKPVVIIYSLE